MCDVCACFGCTTSKMVQTRSMTRAATAAHVNRLYQSPRKEEELAVAQILVSMKKGPCTLDSCSTCYMDDRRPFVSEGFKVFKTYIDGVGCTDVVAPFWAHYCPPCQEYWKKNTLRRSPRIAAQRR
jgi:hypothetical protein